RNGWKTVDFRVAPSTLQPIYLKGLAADTQFEFAGAARPERKGGDFLSYLPSDGAVKLAWKETRPEAEGKLFYSAEMLAQISVSPGLMRQVALLDFKVMQGELNRVELRLRGTGEVTRVQGEQVLAWNVEPGPDSGERRLVVQFNQPQKDQFSLAVQMQTPLGAFPQTAEAMQLRPDKATLFAGYFRIANEGAVRLEIAQATGLSQISPEQFPESDLTRAVFRATGSQRFAYRFSGAEFALKIQADQILPELTVSQVAAYRLGENEQSIDAEIEIDIREAPLRDLLLLVPKGYALARLTATGLSDYFLREPEDQVQAELRLVFGQPQTGRQVIQLRLERNKALADPAWALPRIDVPKAKSVRGHIAAAADAGFRLTPERTQSLTELATAFFPRKVPGIQAAFRLSDPAWEAALRVERLPQTVQADVFHLFSIGEGIAYGSSVINYVVSGAPVSAFKVELSDEYFNVEFTGKDLRNWQKVEGGYLVQLHSPVAGPYTLLATYERPFKAQGETLGFTGVRPLDAQSEQGHTIVISAYQFKVKPEQVSPGLLPLEPGEVPAEYRLFFNAPVLAAYRYTARPFNLKLALSPLAQGSSLSQVVDRAALNTRISKEGQVVTDVRYFVKNRGNTHFRLSLPPGTQLWAASVNRVAVVPVTDANANLIPLPQRGDPNAILRIDLKLASRSASASRVKVTAPTVSAPVMLEEWKLEPDANQRLIYRAGSLAPIGGVPDVSGFAGFLRTLSSEQGSAARGALLMALLLVACAALLWHWAGRPGVQKFSPRHMIGALGGIVAFVFAIVALTSLREATDNQKSYPPREMSLLAPVQQAGSPISVEVANVSDQVTFATVMGSVWPALLALGLAAYGWWADKPWFRTTGWAVGWTLLAWSALRWTNGAGVFVVIIIAFLVLHLLIPSLRRLWQMPAESRTRPAAQGGAAPAVTCWIILGLLAATFGCSGLPADRKTTKEPVIKPPVVAESVVQEI